MDKFLNEIINNKRNFWDIIFLLGCEGFSALCAFITNNIVVTLIYIFVTTIFSICATTYTNINLEKGIDWLVKINRKIIYCIFIIISLLPIAVGTLITNEIQFLGGVEDFIEKIYNYAIPNLLGALIVCSTIYHISKFNTKDIITSVITSKKDFFDVIVRFAFMGAFLNAIVYKMDEKLFWTNIANSVHLFWVVFWGIIILSVFALRLIDKEPFDFTASQIYPTPTLVFAALFLISCGVFPIQLERTKYEVLLLSLNTFAAVMVVWVFMYIIRKKTVKKPGIYPYFLPGLLTIALIVNLCINWLMVKSEIERKTQFLSGISIFLSIFILVIYVCMNKNEKGEC